MKLLHALTSLIAIGCMATAAVQGADATLAKAQAEFEIGNFGTVSRMLEGKNDPQSLVLKGRADSLTRDDYTCFIKAENVSPGFPEALVWKWRYLLNWRNHAPEAYKQLEPAVRAHPNDHELRSTLGMAMYGCGQLAVGLDVMKTEFKKAPTSIACCENLADTYISELEQANAIATLNEGLKVYPKYVALLLRLGKAHQDSGNPKQALADYTRAITINPKCQLAYYNRAALLESMGQHQKAHDDVETGLKINDTASVSKKFLRIKMICAEKMGKLGEAVEAGKFFLKDVPTLKNIDGTQRDLLLALAKDQADLKHYDEGLKTLQLLLHFYPKSTEGLVLQAELHARAGNYNTSLVEYNQLILSDPGMPNWYRERAGVLQKLGKTKEADADLAKAKELDAEM